MKEKRKIPGNALYFKEPLDTDGLSFTDKEGVRSFSMLAYSGKIIKGHWMWGDLAIDLEGMSFPRRAFPILEEHLRDMKIGFSKKKPDISNNELRVNDITLLSNEDADTFYNNAREGFPYEASISARPSIIEEISEGESVEVNGYKMKGPATVFRKTLIREASVCTFGYDSKTSVSVFNDTEEKELDLEILKSYDNSNTQSDKELSEGTSEGKDTTHQGGKQTMKLEDLKEKHPELVASIEEAAKAALGTTLAERDEEITRLKNENEKLSTANKALEVRTAKLEKSDSIRREKELVAKADELFAVEIGKSSIPKRLYPKIRIRVDHGKFVEDESLDEVKFVEAAIAEIKSWETELGQIYADRPAVMGMSHVEPNPDNSNDDKELVDRMVGYVTGSQQQQAAA